MRTQLTLGLRRALTVIFLMLILGKTQHGQASQIVVNEGSTTNVFINVGANQMLEIRDIDAATNGLPGLPLGLHSAHLTISLTKPTAFGTNQSSILPNIGDFEDAVFPIYLQGPMEIRFGITNAAAYIEYDLLPSTGAQTVFFQNETFIADIPTGKSLIFLNLNHAYLEPNVGVYVTSDSYFRVRVGTTTSHPMWCTRKQWQKAARKIDGPATFEIRKEDNVFHPLSPPVGGFATYYLQDEAIALPSGLQTPQGAAVTVEKSSNLQNWSPAVIIPPTGSPKQFFRLKTSN